MVQKFKVKIMQTSRRGFGAYEFFAPHLALSHISNQIADHAGQALERLSQPLRLVMCYVSLVKCDIELRPNFTAGCFRDIQELTEFLITTTFEPSAMFDMTEIAARWI
jgi:hypothetical protein